MKPSIKPARLRKSQQETHRNSPGCDHILDGVPLLLRLARGDVAKAVSNELQAMLPVLDADKVLRPHLGQVLTKLLSTCGDLLLRFSRYTEYPCAIALLSTTYNPGDGKITEFLSCDEDMLDKGYSLPLQREALQHPSFAEAYCFMTGQAVQAELNCIIQGSAASTLDVERAHNTAKMAERRRASSLAKAMPDSGRLTAEQPGKFRVAPSGLVETVQTSQDVLYKS